LVIKANHILLGGVTIKEIAFFFGFFEEALKNRTFVLYSAGDLKNPALLRFKRFKDTLTEYFEALAMAAMAERSMQLQATVQEGSVTFSSDKGSVHIELIRWK
jgi:hypothetical protein